MIKQRVRRIRQGNYPLKAKRNMVANLLLRADSKFEEGCMTVQGRKLTYTCTYDGKEYTGKDNAEVYTAITGHEIKI